MIKRGCLAVSVFLILVLTISGNAESPYSVDFDLRNMAGFDDNTITAEDIVAYIQEKYHDSPMLVEEGIGDCFISAGQSNNVNPAFLVATAELEGRFGTDGWAESYPECHNTFGWAITDKGPIGGCCADSWCVMIHRVSYNIAHGDYYYSQNRFTVSQVREKYATKPNSEAITQYMDELYTFKFKSPRGGLDVPAADISSIGVPEGSPATSQVTLTLYVHDGSANGPIIQSAQVTGQDCSGNSFELTTDSNGYVTITGYPGTWSFSASADGYETNSWDQEITETDTKDAFLQRSAGQSSISNLPSTPIETWNKTFGDGSLNSVIHSDNGYVAAGYTYSLHHTVDGNVVPCSENSGDWRCDEDTLLIKVDYNGNEMWRKAFGGDKADVAFSVMPTTDGGYILEGTTYSYSLRETDPDAWLLKTDSIGNEMWNRTFFGTNYNRFSSVQPTPDGGCVIAAQGNNIVDLRFYSYRQIEDGDAWLIKIDSAGDVVWIKAFDIFSMSGNDYVNSMMLTSDGGCILAGRTGFEGLGYYIDWIMKADSEGNEIWNKAFSETEFISEEQQATNYGVKYYRDSGWVQVGSGFRFKRGGGFINSILPIDGGYILAGSRRMYVDNAGLEEACLTKIDSQGDEIWSKTFSGYVSFDLIQPTQDGGYILEGLGFGGNFEAWLIKVDSEGNEIWSKNLGEIYTGETKLIQPTQDGGYIYKFNPIGAWHRMIKVDSQGKEVWNRPSGPVGYFGSLQTLNSIIPTVEGGCVVAGQNFGDAWLIKIEGDGQAEITHKESQSQNTENLPISGQNAPTREEASEEHIIDAEDTPTNAEESSLPISVGAISLIAADLFMKSKRRGR